MATEVAEGIHVQEERKEDGEGSCNALVSVNEGIHVQEERKEDGEGSCNALVTLNEGIYFHVCEFLAAIDIVQLASTCKSMRMLLEGEAISRWVASSRNWDIIRSKQRIGDLPISANGEEGTKYWTLERLHLYENPPRFSNVNFGFGSAGLELTHAKRNSALDKVVDLMKKHHNVRILVSGHAQPDAPREIALDLSSARARVVCQYISSRLMAHMMGDDDDADVEYAVFPNMNDYVRLFTLVEAPNLPFEEIFLNDERKVVDFAEEDLELEFRKNSTGLSDEEYGRLKSVRSRFAIQACGTKESENTNWENEAYEEMQKYRRTSFTVIRI